MDFPTPKWAPWLALLLVLIGAAAGVLAAWVQSHPSGVETTSATVSVPRAVMVEWVAEDDPGWDCRIYGDRRCWPKHTGEFDWTD